MNTSNNLKQNITGIITTILSGFILMYLSGLKTDMLCIKAETKVNFDKLERTAQINFDNVNQQLSNHLSHHIQSDKEIFERLSCIETTLTKK